MNNPNKLKHTPGPWSSNGSEILAQDKIHIVAYINPDYSNEMWIGDARLIAAAPELLEALQDVIKGLNNGFFKEARPESLEFYQHWLLQTVAKATGGAE